MYNNNRKRLFQRSNGYIKIAFLHIWVCRYSDYCYWQ